MSIIIDFWTCKMEYKAIAFTRGNDIHILVDPNLKDRPAEVEKIAEEIKAHYKKAV